MTDVILAALALLAFAAFLFILGYWVRAPDLIVVLAFGFGLAAYDFWRNFRSNGS